MTRRSLGARWSGVGFIVPLFLVTLVCFDLPLAMMLLRSVHAPRFALDSYAELFGTTAYVQVLVITTRIAVVTTVCCVLLGYPLAWWLHRLRPRARIYALALVVLPFWVSILVRCYAWIVLLGNAGLVNRMLLTLGIVTAPISIIYNEFGIIVGTVNLLLPYFVLPLVAAMMRIDRDLLRAAETMGASETQVFRAVFLPLTLPACAAGALLVFILTFGFYVTPALLGGGRVTMVANLLDLLINQMPDWELASAIATVLLALIIVVQALASGLRRRTQ